MRNRPIAALSVVVLLGMATILALASPALGVADIYTPQWGNGGSNWNGTHGWVMANAARLASDHGVHWIDSELAIERASWPDTVFHDNIDHNYNRWGSYPSPWNSSWGTRFGNPQDKVQEYYNATVAALKRGDTDEASKNIGLMAHYYADINEPLHTQESALETNARHLSYEAAVDSRLSSTSSHRDWIDDNGYQHVASASAFTISSATRAHSYYSSLISNYASHGFNGTVEDITATSLNHAVNGLSDLILSAQDDADQVSATIDSVSPSVATTGVPVTFVGRGHDTAGHAFTAYQWRSSINGVLSGASSFATSGLSMGIHTIYFKARCSHGKWTAEVSTPFLVGAENTRPLPVYRFLNRKSNVHFYTASEAEKRNVVAKLSGTYALEGIVFALDTSSTVNISPLYRFYNFKQGVHFYTADPAEKDHILATLGNVYRYDGIAYNISLTPTDAQPVYRFFNFKKGVHFYTASLAERDNVVAKLGYVYRYEGEAYYYDPPW